MNYVVSFNEKRGGYYVRFRSARHDIRLLVPRRLFLAAEVPDDKPSPRGERIAQRWAAEEAARREREHGDQMTLRELFALYEARNPEHVSASTLTRNRQYAAALTRLVILLPSEVDIDAATEYRNTRSGEKVRNRTVKNELQFLRQVLLFGYESRRSTGMTELSLLRIPTVKAEESTGIALTYEEVSAVLHVPIIENENRIRALILIGVLTGLRLTPLRQFRREWIDHEREWLSVPGEMMKAGKAMSVPVAKAVLELAGEGKGLLFGNRNGNAMKWPKDTVSTICRLAEVREFSAHDLRRTFATWLYDIGVDKLTRARLLGHGSSDVTDDYTKESVARMREAVGKIDAEVVPKLGRIVPSGGQIVPALEGKKYPSRRARGNSRVIRKSRKP